MTYPAWCAAALLAATIHGGAPPHVALGAPASLAIRTGDRWATWWSADAAPTHWDAPLAAVADEVQWKRAVPGLDWGEFTLSGNGEAFRVRVIVARLDPVSLDLRLVRPDDDAGAPGRWSVDRAPAAAVLAVNAGQFTGRPWGWVVQGGVERQRAGIGPLALGVVVGRDGMVRIVAPDSIPPLRETVREGFQSYPALLTGDAVVPQALRAGGTGIDLDHRDARLAIGVQRDGRVLLAMTRFEGLGGALQNLPLGLTTPEMAAVMGALGSQRAVLLDGGISSQLMIKDGGHARTWPGWRKVALGLIATPRAIGPSPRP